MSAVAPLRGREARNAQNDHILAVQVTARQGVAALVREGFTVLRIELEGAKPLVVIQACPRCERLGGSWHRREHGAEGCLFHWQADAHGCRVQWLTRTDRAGG